VVHVFKLPNVKTRHTGNIDIVIVRENLEGEYSGIEHEVYPGVFESLKVITKDKTKRVAQYAFESAFLNGRKKITVVHKANIMKMVDGLFLECCREEARKFSKIEYEEMIVDNTSMQLVKRPEQFDVMLTPNLYGSIITSACAGLVGGAGVVSGAAFGKDYIFFEPGTRRTGMNMAGKDLANPTSMLMASVNMLRALNLPRFGDLIFKALQNVYSEGKYLTHDVGGTASSTEFCNRLVAEVKELDRLKCM
jgi:isocitrate dehydrogenase (NAD+)